MATQLSMFDSAPTEVDEVAPRCRMCARSARWLTGSQQYAMYCAGKACDNRERICQRCDDPFIMGIDGAGTKYCSAPCKIAAKRPAITRSRCAWCLAESESSHRGNVWPYICAACLDPIKHVVDRLKAHRVPHERARRLLDDSGCEVCGINLLTKTRESAHGMVRSLLVVDHDHACCPIDSHSCGRCVRGLICRGCNSAAGLLRDEPKHARSLGDYLDRWRAP